MERFNLAKDFVSIAYNLDIKDRPIHYPYIKEYTRLENQKVK